MEPVETALQKFESLVAKGDEHCGRKEFPQAESFYRDALTALPEGFGAKKRLAHLQLRLASLYEALDQPDQVRAYLSQAIETLSLLKGPSHPVVLELKTYLEHARNIPHPDSLGRL
jgi:hypothetical protein